MHGEDLSIFFDADTFAHVFTVQRLAPPGNTVTGIMGEQDEDGLERLATNRRRQLLYPASAPALRDGDELTRADGAQFKVRGTPAVQNDGQEMLAQIDEVPTP